MRNEGGESRERMEGFVGGSSGSKLNAGAEAGCVEFLNVLSWLIRRSIEAGPGNCWSTCVRVSATCRIPLCGMLDSRSVGASGASWSREIELSEPVEFE